MYANFIVHCICTISEIRFHYNIKFKYDKIFIQQSRFFYYVLSIVLDIKIQSILCDMGAVHLSRWLCTFLSNRRVSERWAALGNHITFLMNQTGWRGARGCCAPRGGARQEQQRERREKIEASLLWQRKKAKAWPCAALLWSKKPTPLCNPITYTVMAMIEKIPRTAFHSIVQRVTLPSKRDSVSRISYWHYCPQIGQTLLER